jgi:hypothetical protein
VAILPLFPKTSKPTQDNNQQEFERQVAERFGLVPNFFRSAPDAPFVVRELWVFEVGLFRQPYSHTLQGAAFRLPLPVL